MKIAFVSQPSFAQVPPTGDSMGLIVHQLAEQLALSNDVTVYGRGRQEELVQELAADGVRYRLVPRLPDYEYGLERWHARAMTIARRVFGTRASFLKRRPLFASIVSHLPYAIRVALDARRQRVEVVHVMNYSQFVPVMRLFNPRAAIVLHMECAWLNQLDPALVRARLRRTDAVVTCSEFLSRQIRAIAPERADRVITVYKGVKPERFESAAGQPESAEGSRTVLFVGRLSPEKGLHVLVDAFARLLDRCPDAKLKIIGPPGVCHKDFIVGFGEDPIIAGLARFYDDGANGESYPDAIVRGLPDRVRQRITFAGTVPNDQLPAHYRECAVFAFPSVCHEGLGLTAVEALASGVPVVAARAGGVVELFDKGDCGIVVERDDVEGLAVALADVLSDADRRARMRHAARRRIEEDFTWSAGARHLRRVYDAARSDAPKNMFSATTRLLLGRLSRAKAPFAAIALAMSVLG